VLVDIQDITGLSVLTEKLRNLIEHSQIQLGEDAIGVTASIGATLVRSGDTSETLVARADQLMYRSKTAGRSRVTLG
jgi:diguanylate cyclase (GGDEF)-like protein